MNVKERELKDGRIVYDLTWQTGKRDAQTGRPVREFETHPGPKREAERRWVRRQAELDQAGAAYTAPAREPLSEYLDRWLAGVSTDLEPSTYTSYEIACRVHLKPALGHIPLNALTADHIQDMLTGMRAKTNQRGEPLSSKTIGNARMILRLALSAIVPRKLPFNPADYTKPPKSDRRRTPALTVEQVQTILAEAECRRVRWLLEFLWLVYMRRGEALGLMWTDLDPETTMLTVQRQAVKVRGEGAVLKPYPKTQSGVRTIALPAQALEVLQHQREMLAGDRRKAGRDYQDLGLIFPTRRGTLTYPDNASQDFKEVALRAGLTVSRMHSLRHSGITMELIAGAPLEAVSKRAGHKDISTTANIYHDLLPEQNRAAAAKTEEYLRQKRRRYS